MTESACFWYFACCLKDSSICAYASSIVSTPNCSFANASSTSSSVISRSMAFTVKVKVTSSPASSSFW